MKHTKLTILILVMVVIMTSIYFFADYNTGKKNFDAPKDSLQTTWETFENKKYGYRVQHRPTTLVFIKEEEERVPPEESASVYIGNVEISAGMITALGARTYVASKKAVQKDLKSFAISAHEYEKGITNLYIDRTVGDLQELAFASTTAYRFIVNETTSEYAKQDAIKRKLPPYIDNGKKLVFIFLANQKNEKFMIKYDTNMKDAQDAEQVVNSFEFTK